MRLDQRVWDGEEPAALAAELRRASAEPEGLAAAVAETIRQVRAEGDTALYELGERFDAARPGALRVADAALADAAAGVPADLRDAMELSAANIRTIAEAQAAGSHDLTLEQGQRIRVDEVPVGAAAIYAPGGRGAYPSSVLMGVIAARAAGVGRVVV
ncbi:MAG: histidinol dehydrogenase, partial [Solirubrobacterales bacterium]|nr:histidinol dehydrogenase [Solirubrobacterales bacterium]